MARSAIDRFTDKISPEPNTGCWLWDAGDWTNGRRYGTFQMKTKRGIRINRAAWLLFRGPLPDEANVLHKCDNHKCVNPDHLWLGTAKDNAADREQKGRGNHASGAANGRHTKPWATSRGDNHYARLHPKTRQGERNGRSVLTSADIALIRRDPRPSRQIGRVYGVSKTTILKIRNKKLWRHL